MQLLDFFTLIETQRKLELPFVLFKKPNKNSISAYLQKTDILYTNLNFSESGFVFAPFLTEKDSDVWLPESECQMITSEIDTDFSFLPQEIEENEDSKARKEHIAIVDKAIEKLESGVLQKVVISRSELQNVDSKKPIDWFQRMSFLYPGTFCYCWYHPKVGMWLGASPEVLISLKNKAFTTMALAGTMPYKTTTNVKWGEKEKEEQQMVVDSIVKELQLIVSTIELGETKTQKAGSLLHLKTIISGQLTADNQLQKLIDLLHPTSAICGLPKQKAKDFIIDNEGYDRNYYTGYLGVYKKEGNTSLFVNLRCMEALEKAVKIYIGGGITAASKADLEWQETVNKSQIMKAIL